MGLPKTTSAALRYFSNPDNCREFLVARRWPHGVICPQCGSTSVYVDSSRNGWECKTRHPKRKFTLKTGTVFEDSALGFDKWLPVVWMIANCRHGVTSHEVARAIGVTQKTAWFMLHRIRLATQDDETGGRLGGGVAVNETHAGSKAVTGATRSGRPSPPASTSMGMQDGRNGPSGADQRRAVPRPHARRPSRPPGRSAASR
ncbi:MAG: transposase [Vicinamibacterales bacterium]